MEDVLTILSDWQNNLDSSGSPLATHPGVLHSFSGNQINAEQVQDINFSIGITGPVTFDKAVQLQALVKQMPGKAILIETDAPFLTPHPYRGKRNEPSRVKLVAEKIAELREEAYNTIANTTTENAAQLFGW
jgi:TatD DNase family protein